MNKNLAEKSEADKSIRLWANDKSFLVKSETNTSTKTSMTLYIGHLQNK